eukprot:TRINITY_DN15333_c0_g1_i1.p1 TRINITY_DN15333_c0_g1~~TRINITY_DN15333_c0_g1_i1.p1  ORF type:complete len:358 (+),score=50.02 TRINITY_DN15333_c0_g1_i1:62-1135(+)
METGHTSVQGQAPLLYNTDVYMSRSSIMPRPARSGLGAIFGMSEFDIPIPKNAVESSVPALPETDPATYPFLIKKLPEKGQARWLSLNLWITDKIVFMRSPDWQTWEPYEKWQRANRFLWLLTAIITVIFIVLAVVPNGGSLNIIAAVGQLVILGIGFFGLSESCMIPKLCCIHWWCRYPCPPEHLPLARRLIGSFFLRFMSFQFTVYALHMIAQNATYGGTCAGGFEKAKAVILLLYRGFMLCFYPKQFFEFSKAISLACRGGWFQEDVDRMREHVRQAFDYFLIMRIVTDISAKVVPNQILVDEEDMRAEREYRAPIVPALAKMRMCLVVYQMCNAFSVFLGVIITLSIACAILA